MRKIISRILLVTIGVFSLNANAAELAIDATGQLVGATGVVVNGLLYDVRFSNDGDCSDLYTGCDDAGDFSFNSLTNAIRASNALLEQVFVDIYDTMPNLTIGCSNLSICNVWTVYNSDLINDVVSIVAAVNGVAEPDGTSPISIHILDQTTPSSVWAIWSPSTAVVPVPGAIVLMLSGLAGLAGFRRKS